MILIPSVSVKHFLQLLTSTSTSNSKPLLSTQEHFHSQQDTRKSRVSCHRNQSWLLKKSNKNQSLSKSQLTRRRPLSCNSRSPLQKISPPRRKHSHSKQQLSKLRANPRQRPLLIRIVLLLNNPRQRPLLIRMAQSLKAKSRIKLLPNRLKSQTLPQHLRIRLRYKRRRRYKLKTQQIRRQQMQNQLNQLSKQDLKRQNRLLCHLQTKRVRP